MTNIYWKFYALQQKKKKKAIIQKCLEPDPQKLESFLKKLEETHKICWGCKMNSTGGNRINCLGFVKTIIMISLSPVSLTAVWCL